MGTRVILVAALLYAAAAAAATAALLDVAAASNSTVTGLSATSPPASCILKMLGDSAGRPSINFTCSGPAVKATITDKFINSPPLLHGVFPGSERCTIPRCIITLCSNATPVVFEQGSELRFVRSDASLLCIAGSAIVNLTGMFVADNEVTPNLRGAVRVFGRSMVNIEGCHFQNNNCSALRVQNNPSLAISGTMFEGGRVQMEATTAVCPNGGGAISACAERSIPPNHPITITNSTFVNNTVEGFGSGGGAIYTEWHMVWQSLNLTNNTVNGSMAGGGAVWVHRSTNLTANHTNFTGNYVLGDASEGGAIYALPNSSINLRGGVLQNNMALGSRSRGGAVSTVANLNDFDNVTLHDNHVLGPFGQGGAVFMNDIGVLHCDQCSFYSNTAEFGGAVAALDAQINMTNSSFTSNFATQYDGGAIYAVSTNITKMSLFGCNLTSNRAMFDGGAVFARKAVQDEPAAAEVYSEMYVPDDSLVLKVALSGSHLSRNTAMRGSGGAVNVDGAHLMLGEVVEFWHNDAAVDGGALAVYALVSNQTRADANLHVAPGCLNTWGSGIAALNISQQGVVFNGNKARRAGGAGFIGKYVHCNTGTVLSQNRAAAGFNKAGSSNVFQMHGLCDAGHEWLATVGACVRCKHGAYKMHADVNESTGCTTCSASAGYLCFGGDTVLPLPHYWVHDYRLAAQNSFAAASIHTATLTAYWCPGHAACPGCSFSCSAGYQGRLCSECAAGYSSPTPFKCTACGYTAWRNLAISSLATVVIVYVLWIVAWCTCSSDEGFFSWGDVLKQVLWFCQGLVIIGRSSDFAWAWFARNFWTYLAVAFAQGELGSVPAIQCLWGAALTARLPWGLWRGLLSAILPVIWVALLIFVHVTFVGMLSLCGFRAKHVHWADAKGYCGVCRYPFTLVGVALGLDLSFPEWWAELKHRFRLLAYVVLGFFYPVLLRISLSSFFCIRVEGTEYWSVDMSMTCWDGQHLPWMICVGVFVGLVLVIVVPIFYNFTWLARKADNAQQSDARANLQDPSQLPASLSFGVTPGTRTGVDRVRQYLYGAYREGCKVWEGLLQIRLVWLVLISVASPSMGPYYTLLAYGAVLAALMMLHDLQKPYKDLGLQQLQTLAYCVLLVNVGLGIIVVTATGRPGPRPANAVQSEPTVTTNRLLHCPYQQGGDPNLSTTVVAASVLMVVFNTVFGIVACLTMFSLCTRELRGKQKNDQLLQRATVGAPFWVLGLGLDKSSRFGIPVIHAGYWTTAGKAELPVPLNAEAANSHWVITAFICFCGWVSNILCTSLWLWPAEASLGHVSSSQDPAAEASLGHVSSSQDPAAEASLGHVSSSQDDLREAADADVQIEQAADFVCKAGVPGADGASSSSSRRQRQCSGHAAAHVPHQADLQQEVDQTRADSNSQHHQAL